MSVTSVAVTNTQTDNQAQSTTQRNKVKDFFNSQAKWVYIFIPALITVIIGLTTDWSISKGIAWGVGLLYASRYVKGVTLPKNLKLAPEVLMISSIVAFGITFLNSQTLSTITYGIEEIDDCIGGSSCFKKDPAKTAAELSARIPLLKTGAEVTLQREDRVTVRIDHPVKVNFSHCYRVRTLPSGTFFFDYSGARAGYIIVEPPKIGVPTEATFISELPTLEKEKGKGC